MNRKYKFTDEELCNAVASSFSKRACLELLGLNSSGGGNYVTLTHRIKTCNIDTSHWTGKGWLKGKTHNIKNKNHIDLKEILIENSTYKGSTSALKKRLIKTGLLKTHCYDQPCSVSEVWNGKPIVLQLDHINGIKSDNRIENLRLLCPNCHSQTETWSGKNKKKS